MFDLRKTYLTFTIFLISLFFVPVSILTILSIIFEPARIKMTCVLLIILFVYVLTIYLSKKFVYKYEHYLKIEGEELIIINSTPYSSLKTIYKDKPFIIKISDIIEVDHYGLNSIHAWMDLLFNHFELRLYSFQITYMQDGKEQKIFDGNCKYKDLKKLCEENGIKCFSKIF